MVSECLVAKNDQLLADVVDERAVVGDDDYGWLVGTLVSEGDEVAL